MRPSNALYAARLDLSEATVVVLGAGAVALRKLKGLPRGVKRVRIVAPRCSAAVRAWARGRPQAALVRRRFRGDDVRGCRVLFCCCDDPLVNARAARLARARGAWVCQAAQGGQGDLSVPAVVRAAGVELTLSTGGASPALAKALRRRLEAALGASDLGWVLRRLGALRPALNARPAAKARLLRRLLAPAALEDMLAPRSRAGRRRLQSLLTP